jgi:hypothetical protein
MREEVEEVDQMMEEVVVGEVEDPMKEEVEEGVKVSLS